MNITFTVAELQNFQRKLSLWHIDRTIFIIERLAQPDIGAGFRIDSRKERVERELADYDKVNPMPDWRSLL